VTFFRRARRVTDLGGALLAAVVLLVVAQTGAAGVPAPGRVLSPGGVWRLSPASGVAVPETIQLPALERPATVSFEDNGIAHLRTADDLDLFRVIGYVHARHRLGQMDLARRLPAGELSEVLGEAALESDRFELDLGLRRAAERDWREMARDDPARSVLVAYAAGVNAAMGELAAAGRLPELFKVLDYRPRPWTPVDSLLVQRSLTQTLSFVDKPVTFSHLAGALDPATFATWFPEIPANQQYPYDRGPYRRLALEPLPVRADPVVAAGSAAAPAAPLPTRTAPQRPDLTPLRNRLAALPAGAVHRFGNSNSWVLAGHRTASGKPLLAADPHLDFSLPSVWYQLEGRSPGYGFTGVTVPGIPVPLIGKTDRFAWAVTNSQRPATLYYVEDTDPANPRRYRWRGGWRAMDTVRYDVKVRGAAPVRHEVRLTAHGPVVQMSGVTASVWWGGTLPSANVRSIVDMLRAGDFNQVRQSFRGWATPALNVAYADVAGNIGAFNIGIAPQVGGDADFSLPLAGDGSADVIGTIAFDALPVTYNPPDGLIVAANQREVGPGYPYQYSRSFNFADQGWRAAEIVHGLGTDGATLAGSARLQSDQHDNLARQLIPQLLPSLDSVPLNENERAVRDRLATWDYSMAGDSDLAQFFQFFNNRVVHVALRPWWDHFHVPDDPDGLVVLSPDGGSFATEVLRGTVLSWVLSDPGNRYLTPPGGAPRDARAVLVEAFRQATARMVEMYGPPFDKWRYDLRRRVLFPSLLQLPAFDDGPHPWGGNGRTINAAVGTLLRDGKPIPHTATGGATWRYVVDLGTGQAQSILAGGQSESPLSPWYRNGIPRWLAGEFWPVLEGTAADSAARTTWRFRS
jgi:penicillin G amidase